MENVVEFGGVGPQDVTVTTSGQASVEGFISLIDDLLGHERYRRGMAVLADHSALDLTALRGYDMQSIAQKFVDLDERIGAARLAIVAGSPASFGLVRIFEAYADAARVDVSVFYSRAEAEDWLGEA